MFVIGREYTRNEIHDSLGGSKQSYLPTVDGHVVAACVRKDLNPRAPYVILCGRGPIISTAGTALAHQKGPIPFFIKRAVNRWEYVGDFSVKSSHSSGTTFNSLISGSGRKLSDVSLAIEMA